MKKFNFAVKALLGMALIASVATACGNDTTELPAPVVINTEATAQGCRIAYVDGDSILRGYILAQELNRQSEQMMSQLQLHYNSSMQELQAMANQIEQKRQNNIYLSEVTFQADVNNLNQRQQQAEQRFQNQQMQVQQTMAQAQARLNDSINNCVEAFNATAQFDAILFKESGIYFNPALDITGPVLQMLNARYQASQAQ